MGWWGPAAWTLLAGALVGCNPLDLTPVDDTGDTDTGGDTGVQGLIGILVSPERAAVPLGGELQLTATGLRDDRTSVDVTALATWGSDHPEVATVSDDLDSEGLLSGLSVGEAEVFADVDGVQSVPVRVTVTDATLLGLSVKPEELTVSKGDVAHLEAEAAFSDGTRSDASAQVIWVTGNGAVATLEAGGTLTAVEVGSTTVHAEWEGKSSPDVPVSVVVGAEANLQIASVGVESGGGSATLTVRVKNAGTAGASDFWVDVFLDPPAAPVPGSLGDYYAPVAYADAGQEVELSYTIDGRAGDHEIWVVADIDDAVAESDETDNTHHATYPFEVEPAGPNLTITWFDYYADSTEIFYVIDVYNGGSEDVGQFYVDLWIDSATDPTSGFVGDEFRDFEGLAKGETAYVDFVVPVSGLDASLNGCASCTSWVKVDTNDNVAETDETDNVAGPIDVEVP